MRRVRRRCASQVLLWISIVELCCAKKVLEWNSLEVAISLFPSDAEGQKKMCGREEERPLGHDGIGRGCDPGCPHTPSLSIAILRRSR
eukprot:Skav229702  [mRNA]  locus=scaffold49:39426:39689:+ [translate_table: standard]